MNTHADYLSKALNLAEKGRCTVSPNPMVGCLIVKNNQIIGQGFHQRAGGPHAEIIALAEAGSKAREATLYVTLEPCCHVGKTSACTDALIAAGIKQVFIACQDPNPLVAGKGIQQLQAAGIDVQFGLLEKEALALNEIFFHYITHQRPFVIAKWAMSLDGKTVTHPLDSKIISGEDSNFHTHQLRQTVDAILVGANTLLADNPQLTVRHVNPVKQPVRIVLVGKQVLPTNLTVFSDPIAKTIIATTARHQFKVAHIKAEHVEILVLPEDENQNVDLLSLLTQLGKKKITSLLVEGGMTVHHYFFEKNLVNKIYAYLSLKFIGAFPQKQSLTLQQSYQVGEDFHFVATCKGVNHV